MNPTSPALRWFWLPFARMVGAIFFFCLGGVRVIGKSRIPKTGGLLVLANHVSDLDPPVVQYACPRAIRFMAKSELFDMKGVGAALRTFQSFPVRRDSADRESIRMSVDLLKDGQVVGVFPEGELSEDGELQELKAGTALIIRLAQCRVICCGLKGTNEWMPYGKLTPKPNFKKVQIVWGEPMEFRRDEDSAAIMCKIEAEFRRLIG
jgi:1-acyl-sn-glycerol-3-phosphate acyltransferase